MITKNILCLPILVFITITGCTSTPYVSSTQNSPSSTVNLLTSTPKPITTPTKKPTKTFTPTLKPSNTPTVTHTNTPTQQPTNTPIPKPVLIGYGIMGGDIGDEIYACLGWRLDYSFVLYEDGQLIILGKNGLTETFLNDTQIRDLIRRIEGTGFLQIEGTGEFREQDPIYRIPEGYWAGDGAPYIVINVKRKYVRVYTPLEEFVIGPIKQALSIIRNYHPKGLVPYKPQRIDLYFYLIDDPNMEFQVATPIPPMENWPSNLPSLTSLDKNYDENNYPGRGVIEGENVQVLTQMIDRFPSSKIFIEDNQQYLVAVCPSLP